MNSIANIEGQTGSKLEELIKINDEYKKLLVKSNVRYLCNYRD